MLGIIAIAAVIFYMQGFTIFDFVTSESFHISTGRPLSKTFYFDDYKLVATGTSYVKSFSGCATPRITGDCNQAIDHYDALNCPIYRYNKLDSRGKCLTGTTYYAPDDFGARFYTENYGCFWRGQLYYKDKLIRTFNGPFVNPTVHLVLEQYNQYINGGGYTKESERVYLTNNGIEGGDYFYVLYFGGSLFSNNNQICEDIDGEIRIHVPADSFQFNLTVPTQQLYTSDTAQIQIKVTQTVSAFQGKLIVDYEVPTTIGPAKKTVSTDVHVSTGVNNYIIQIPTEQVTDKIKITPSLELYYDTSGWTDYPGTPYSVGQIIGDTQIISIRPAAEREVIALQGQLLTAEEKIAIIQASIQTKVLIIENITKILEQQGQIIEQLNLSSAQNAQLIQQLSSKVSEQAVIIGNMNNTIQENILIISSMYTKIEDQATLINQLTETQVQKDIYIAGLLTNIAGQESKINELSSIVKVNAEQILKMDVTIEQQAQTIAALNVNLQEKERIAAEVYTKLAQQDDRVQFLLQAIDELQLDNKEISNLLNSYQTRLQDDAVLISSLKLTKEELVNLISTYKRDLSKEKQLVSQLKLDNEVLTAIIKDYEQRLVIQQQTAVILQASNAELNANIAKYKANLITAEQLIVMLNISNSELTVIVRDYDIRLKNVAQYIAELNLTNQQLTELVKLLSDENEYQQQLILEFQQTTPINPILMGAIILVVCIVAYLKYKKLR